MRRSSDAFGRTSYAEGSATPASPRRFRTALGAALAVAILGGALGIHTAGPASAAFGPNLLVNPGFEAPAVPTGDASAPYGTCSGGAPVTGCWQDVPLFPGSSADRSARKAGLQSLALDGNECVGQTVVAGPGTYQLDVWAFTSAANGLSPLANANVSAANDAGTAMQSSSVTAAPVIKSTNGASYVATWTKLSVRINAPVGTTHLAVILCNAEYARCGFHLPDECPEPEWGPTARIDATVLRQVI